MMSFIGGSGAGGNSRTTNLDEKRAEAARKPAFKFDSFPLWLREGPWKWTFWVYMGSIVCALISSAPSALSMFPSSDRRALTLLEQGAVAACCAWNMYIIHVMLRDVGWFPMVSFTMISWSILLLRMACLLLAPFARCFAALGEVLHAPAIINAVVVCCVWWCVLLPLISLVMKSQVRYQITPKP